MCRITLKGHDILIINHSLYLITSLNLYELICSLNFLSVSENILKNEMIWQLLRTSEITYSSA